MKRIVLYNFALLAGFAAFFLSPSNKTTDPTEEESQSTAHFDFFRYKGEDDYYIRNPLTDDDQFYNPVLPGWYSDPSICTNGEDYFLVTSTFSYFPGVPIFHSKDLVNWKQIGHVLDRPSQLKLDGQGVSQGIFAPAISYNPHNKTYYMITTNIGGGNFFVKTKDPFGAWSDPIWLRDVKGIDPSFFFDDDGRAYIVNNDAPDSTVLYDGHRAIRIQEFEVANDRTFGPRKMLVNGGVDLREKPVWIEGPHLYKVNGKYLLMAAEGGTGPNHREVIFYSDAPMGTFTPWHKNPILTQRHLDPARPEPITCAGHADLVQTKKGEWWSVFLACRPIDNKFENLGRETFLMPVKWSDDGFPYMTAGMEVVPRILRMKGAKRQAETAFGNFEKTDPFDGDRLGMEWMTLRGPASGLYSLTTRPGFLSLRCAEAGSGERTEIAFVSRRLQHHKFEATTTVHFQPGDEHDAAGVLLLKDEGHQYFFSIRKSGNGRKVSVEKITAAGTEVVNSMSLPAAKDPVRLKVVSDGVRFSFHAAAGKDAWMPVAEGIDAHFLSTANSFGFTGTNIGLYATGKAVEIKM
jgi:xylan 1,4-beta-xylosidase